MRNIEGLQREHGYLVMELSVPIFIYSVGQRFIKVEFKKKLEKLTLIKLGFLKVVFSGVVKLTPTSQHKSPPT